jgi:hypothetical protein
VDILSLHRGRSTVRTPASHADATLIPRPHPPTPANEPARPRLVRARLPQRRSPRASAIARDAARGAAGPAAARGGGGSGRPRGGARSARRAAQQGCGSGSGSGSSDVPARVAPLRGDRAAHPALRRAVLGGAGAARRVRARPNARPRHAARPARQARQRHDMGPLPSPHAGQVLWSPDLGRAVRRRLVVLGRRRRVQHAVGAV